MLSRVRVLPFHAPVPSLSHPHAPLRLNETALGAAVAIVVVMLVLPLRTRQVLRIATRDPVQAVGRLADHASGHLLGADHDTGTTLRSDARAVDAAYQALAATAQPAFGNLFGGAAGDVSRVLQLASTARNYGRSLVADTERAGGADNETRLDTELASATLRDCLGMVVSALTGSRDGAYTRSSSLFDRAERRLEENSSTVGPTQLVIRDLMLIDGTMAELAGLLGLAIIDYDTTPAGPGGTRVRGRQEARAVAGPEGTFRLDTPTGDE